MKKLPLTVILVFAVFYSSFAQWTTPSAGVVSTTNAVGIGTTTPTSDQETFDAANSRPGGISAPTKSVLKISRAGTFDYSYNEAAEFRIGHGGPDVWAPRLIFLLMAAAIPPMFPTNWQ